MEAILLTNGIILWMETAEEVLQDSAQAEIHLDGVYWNFSTKTVHITAKIKEPKVLDKRNARAESKSVVEGKDDQVVNIDIQWVTPMKYTGENKNWASNFNNDEMKFEDEAF